MILEKMPPGEVIREIRTKRGMTQKDVADAIGVSISTLCKWEKGARHMNIERFEELLDVMSAVYTVRY